LAAENAAFRGLPRPLAANRVARASRTSCERPICEIKRRTEVIGIFPNEAAIVRLVDAILLEQNDGPSSALFKSLWKAWLLSAMIRSWGCPLRLPDRSGSGSESTYWLTVSFTTTRDAILALPALTYA